jgi:hypothetical protein
MAAILSNHAFNTGEDAEHFRVIATTERLSQQGVANGLQKAMLPSRPIIQAAWV